MKVVIHKLCRGSEDQVWSLYQNYPELMQAREKGTTDPTILGEKTYLVGLANMGCGIFGIWGGVSNLFKLQSEANRCQMRHPGTIGADWCRQYRTGAILKLLMNIRQWESE